MTYMTYKPATPATNAPPAQPAAPRSVTPKKQSPLAGLIENQTNPTFAGLAIDYWPIDRPIPFAKNARKWSPRAIATLASSIKEYGFRQPIVVDAADVIVIGHLRLAAAKSLDLTEVPVHVARDLTALQIRGLRIADNRTAQEATFDFDLLGPELLDLKALDFNLDLTGFEADEISGLLIKAGLSEGLTDEDAVPEAPADPVTVLGDLWLLGAYAECPHCGTKNDV